MLAVAIGGLWCVLGLGGFYIGGRGRAYVVIGVLFAVAALANITVCRLGAGRGGGLGVGFVLHCAATTHFAFAAVLLAIDIFPIGPLMIFGILFYSFIALIALFRHNVLGIILFAI